MPTIKQYPANVDQFKVWVDDSDSVVAACVNDVQSQIVVIENTLGINPQGSVADLKTRLAVSLNNDGTLKTSAIGATGIQGLQGSTGIQGTNGTAGSQGATGIQGLQGSTGIGTNGQTGVQGLQGATGLQGTVGLAGSQGATGIQGTNGQTGVQGIQGSTGLQGAVGQTGIQGLRGNTGIQGLQGATGLQGNNGTVGSQGATGVLGLQGFTGLQGTNGSAGSQGATGIQGLRGVTGAQGLQGATGINEQSGSTYSMTTTDFSLIFFHTVTVTLLSASLYPGRVLWIKGSTQFEGAIITSASSNIKTINNIVTTTIIDQSYIMPGEAKWAMLQSDGAYWVTMATGQA